MARVIDYVAVSLDGFIAPPGGGVVLCFVPVIAGGGSPLFAGSGRVESLPLLESTTDLGGLVQARYAPGCGAEALVP